MASKTFSAIDEVLAPQPITAGTSFTAEVAGHFDGSAVLERSHTGGSGEWVPVRTAGAMLPVVMNGPGMVYLTEPEGASYRWRPVVLRSGAMKTRVGAA